MKERISRDRDSAVTGGPTPPAPSFEVELLRSIRTLADIPPLKAVFGSALSNETLNVADARKYLGTSYGDFMATPIFLTAGWRNVPAPVLNEDVVRRVCQSFVEPDGSSPVQTVIGEACRNVGQHGGRNLEGLRHGVARFAPGGVFMKQLGCLDSDKVTHRALLCMVADEGIGISNPSLSLLDGVGGIGGEDHRGMGVELARSLVTLIKSSEGRWFLYDGLNHNRDGARPPAIITQGRIPKSQWVKPLAEVELPAADKGCQKIFLFAHPQADKQFLFKEVVNALAMSTVSSR